MSVEYSIQHGDLRVGTIKYLGGSGADLKKAQGVLKDALAEEICNLIVGRRIDEEAENRKIEPGEALARGCLCAECGMKMSDGNKYADGQRIICGACNAIQPDVAYQAARAATKESRDRLVLCAACGKILPPIEKYTDGTRVTGERIG